MNITWRFGRLALVVLVALTAELLSPQPLLHAGPSGVVGTGSAASCTEAALDAALAGGGTITFNCGLAPTTIVVITPKTIALDMTIDGANLITLSGGNAVRVIDVPAGVNARLSNLTISNGLAANSYGGGIRNRGTLLLTNCRILKNRTTGDGNVAGGGGISNEGTLTLADSLVTDNTSVLGGGINNNGSLTISTSQISGNSATEEGGGLFNYYSGEATIRNSRIEDNVTIGHATLTGGGGILNANRLALTDVVISDNATMEEGGGIFNQYGTTTLTSSTVSGNSALRLGGGIFNENGTTILSSTTVSGNAASGAGGLGNVGLGGTATTTLTNATLSGNSATDSRGVGGGGILNDAASGGAATTALLNVTLSGNAAAGNGAEGGGGSGIANYAGSGGTATTTLKNTIVANSLASYNCLGAINSTGYNLAVDASCGLKGPGDQQDLTQLLLGPLADNGGPTQTHMPQPGSPAIDHGSDCPATDQRGAARPVGSACDIGAVEYGAVLPRVYLPLVLR